VKRRTGFGRSALSSGVTNSVGVRVRRLKCGLAEEIRALRMLLGPSQFGKKLSNI